VSPCLTAPATAETSPPSLHDALPISLGEIGPPLAAAFDNPATGGVRDGDRTVCRAAVDDDHLADHAVRGGRHERGQRMRQRQLRSDEHTSELQSRENLVCRLLLEKKK